MKSQIFTSSIITISFIAIMILFSYNQFYLQSKGKLNDYLIIDEMQAIANNHFNVLQEIIGNKIYFQKNNNDSSIFFESYINNNYSPNNLLLQYKSLIEKNRQNIRRQYSFFALENDLINGFSKRTINQSKLIITHNYSGNQIIFENLTQIKSIKLNFDLNGQLLNQSFCESQNGGKKITIAGPNNFLMEFERINNCAIDLLIQNNDYSENLEINLVLESGNASINYESISNIIDLNLKAELISDYENLFKISSNYNNVNIALIKGAYNLTKSMD